MHASRLQARAALVAVVGVLLLLVTPALAVGAPVRPGPTATAIGLATSGPCAGSSAPASVRGRLTVDGGPLPPSAAASVLLNVTFYTVEQSEYFPNQTLLPSVCGLLDQTVGTNATGNFSTGLVVPTGQCEPTPPSGEICTSYSGMYAPVSVVPVASPAGYALSAHENGSEFTLAWVAELASLDLVPPGPVLSSPPGASVRIVAQPLSANGSESLLAPTYDWNLSGAGWSWVGPPSGSSATLVAAAGSANGSLTVSATATAGNLTFTAPPKSLRLVEVATTIGNASLDRASVDANQSLGLTVRAFGALGFPYRATVEAGLGAAITSVNCTAAPASTSAAAVDCAPSVRFPESGESRVRVTVSNGYSSASWLSPNVTVAPDAELAVAPSAPEGYPGTGLTVVLAAANGSGIRPFGTACFAPGTGTADCQGTPGPSWTFRATYAAAGDYAGLAWVVDASGTNRSIDVPVHVVDRPAVGAISPANATCSAGQPLHLVASLAGGALPARAWWNVSGSGGTFAAGWLVADGPFSAEFVAPGEGSFLLTLTVRDALGSESVTNLTLVAGPGPAVAATVAPAASNLSVEVGHAVTLLWQAVDALGEPVPSFTAAVDLTVTTAGGRAAPAWANLSALGALSPEPAASFAVPATAWDNGTLRLELTPAAAGPLLVRLETPALVHGASAVGLAVSPDLGRLMLFDPTVALAGLATNRTFWHVSDRFGDPVPGAMLTLQYSAPGTVRDTLLPVDAAGTGAWVNYSFPAVAGASVRLLDAAGDVLAGPTPLLSPSAGPGGPGLGSLLLGLSVGGALAVGAVVALDRRRRSRATRRAPSEEEAARELAEGRAQTVEILRVAPLADREEVAAAWRPPPAPVDLDEWLASLLADGTITSERRPDGAVGYLLAPLPPAGPRIVVDEGALARAVAARDAELGDETEPGT